MAIRAPFKQSEHDTIVRASAATYTNSLTNGYQVATNPDGEHNRFVGPATSPKYPDVVVWKPSALNSTSGTAHIIEEIETEDSVNREEAEQWREYASLGVEKFILVVPQSKAHEAYQLVMSMRIRVTEIWYYFYDNGVVKFSKYT